MKACFENAPAVLTRFFLQNLWGRYLLILVLGIVVFGHSLSYPFVWDDEGLVTRNPHLHSLSDIPEIFSTDLYWGQSGNAYYRPIQAVSNLLNKLLFGETPWSFRLVNILLHSTVAFLLFMLFLKLFTQPSLAFGAAVVWLVHPVQVEAVTYIAGRADSLYSVFVLVSLLMQLKADEVSTKRKRIYWSLASYSAFLLAVFSKEVAFVFFPLLALIDLYKGKSVFSWGYLKRLLPFAASFLFYVACRSLVLPDFFGGDSSWGAMANPLGIWVFPAGLFYGLRLLVFPYPLHMERIAIGVRPDGPAWMTLGWIFFALCIYGLWRARKTKPDWTFSSAFYFFGMLPMAILLLRDQLYLDHWLYLGAFGPIYLAGAAVVSGARKLATKFENTPSSGKDLSGVFLFLVFLVLSVLTVQQNRIWRDPIVLYRHILKYTPESDRVHSNLAQAYLESGWSELAELHFQLAGMRNPKSDQSAKLALLRMQQGKLDEALELINAAIAKEPDQAIQYNNRASILHRLGRTQEALKDLGRALELNPGYADAYLNLGIISRERGQIRESIQYLNKAAGIKLTSEIALLLAKNHMAQKNYSEAFAILEKGIDADQSDPHLYNILGVLYADQKAYGKAELIWMQGLKLHPESVELKTNLKTLQSIKSK